MEVICIGDILTVRTLTLLGVSGEVTDDPGEALKKIRQALSGSEPVMILIPTSLAAGMGEAIQQIKVSTRGESVIIEIPDLTGRSREIDNTLQMVARTVGIKVQ